jgi:beta-mannosidase
VVSGPTLNYSIFEVFQRKPNRSLLHLLDCRNPKDEVRRLLCLFVVLCCVVRACVCAALICGVLISSFSVFLFLLGFVAVACASKPSSDPPIFGAVHIALDNWTLNSGGLVARDVSVPGDIVSDLFHSGIVPEMHTDHNWLKFSQEWWGREWVYTCVFDASAQGNLPVSFFFHFRKLNFVSGANTILVFDGVKMGAHVVLNGVHISDVPNQFLRYHFDVSTLLKDKNVLTVTFPSSVNNSTGIDTEGRFMACSGGWDWAPYGNYFDERGSRIQSRGIWKDVYLVQFQSVLVSQVVPTVYHRPGNDLNSFYVNFTIHYSSQSSSVFDVKVGWSTRRVRVTAANTGGQMKSISFTQNVTIGGDQLWHPRKPFLFNVSVCHLALGGCFYHTRVGFRSVKLVTTDLQDSQGQGSGNFTMRLDVNGVPVLLRGANWIPSALFEGLVTKEDLRASVKHAYDAGFNVLRVWGGEKKKKKQTNCC